MLTQKHIQFHFFFLHENKWHIVVWRCSTTFCSCKVSSLNLAVTVRVPWQPVDNPGSWQSTKTESKCPPSGVEDGQPFVLWRVHCHDIRAWDCRANISHWQTGLKAGYPTWYNSCFNKFIVLHVHNTFYNFTSKSVKSTLHADKVPLRDPVDWMNCGVAVEPGLMGFTPKQIICRLNKSSLSH